MNKPVRLGVFISGGGTTLQNLIDRIADGRLHASIGFVLSSRDDAFGLQRAESAGIPTVVVPSREFSRSWDLFSRTIDQAIEPYEVDLIVLAGFMCLYRYPDRFEGRVINVHPALIPSFCGKGMFGHHVHEGVIASGVKVSGCTVHFVDRHYDSGPIIMQKTVPVFFDDTPDMLAERVMAAEREALPEAIELFAQGRLKVEGRRVQVLPAQKDQG